MHELNAQSSHEDVDKEAQWKQAQEYCAPLEKLSFENVPKVLLHLLIQ